ncbi:hypothetical protein [Nostoc sp.]|uniref:hypothetical protein n=1 Tax=Nostoc sp. TaxID=1180 RepID=UPI002FFA944B
MVKGTGDWGLGTGDWGLGAKPLKLWWGLLPKFSVRNAFSKQAKDLYSNFVYMKTK